MNFFKKLFSADYKKALNLDAVRECKSLIGKDRCKCEKPIVSPPNAIRAKNKTPMGCGICNLYLQDKFQPTYVP